MKAVLTGLITTVCLATQPYAEEVSGPGIRLDPSVWKTSEEPFHLLIKSYSFQRFDNKKLITQDGYRYGTEPKLVGAFPIAFYWVSGEEGLREALLARRAGRILIGIRHTF